MLFHRPFLDAEFSALLPQYDFLRFLSDAGSNEISSRQRII